MGSLMQMRPFQLTDFDYIFCKFKERLRSSLSDVELNQKIKNRMSKVAKCWVCEQDQKRIGFVIVNYVSHFLQTQRFAHIDWIYLDDEFCNRDCVNHIYTNCKITADLPSYSLIISRSSVLNPNLNFIFEDAEIETLDQIYKLETN